MTCRALAGEPPRHGNMGSMTTTPPVPPRMRCATSAPLHVSADNGRISDGDPLIRGLAPFLMKERASEPSCELSSTSARCQTVYGHPERAGKDRRGSVAFPCRILPRKFCVLARKRAGHRRSFFDERMGERAELRALEHSARRQTVYGGHPERARGRCSSWSRGRSRNGAPEEDRPVGQVRNDGVDPRGDRQLYPSRQ